MKITDSVFDSISNCGSIIRNYYKFIDYNSFNWNLIINTDTQYLNDFPNTVDLLKRDYFKELFDMNEASFSIPSNPYSCTNDTTNTTHPPCFKIEI